ncbi:hypothetical protein DHEL01_v209222 [Diaporthe helianthi]|uniref:Uncharacterized protein n=1 Tax=Diaporthe helianthi TaxID=158607 RepID=A0A2P5HQ42_DIAHE|nr:hypothetical protein DHEL01_v209222 [Diaporthe helianthi]
MTPEPKPHLNAWGPVAVHGRRSQPFEKMPRAEAYALRRQILIWGLGQRLLADHGRPEHPASKRPGTAAACARAAVQPLPVMTWDEGGLIKKSRQSLRGTLRRLTILGDHLPAYLHRKGQDQSLTSLHAVGWQAWQAGAAALDLLLGHAAKEGGGRLRGRRTRRRTTSRAPKPQAPLGLVPG